ncbi:NAD(P)/FAD-dependent oxidoreductase [Microterricola viridarii]|uniref:Pyridine nucleotide-disulfide oxidoreductase n=1 Tax=Microterricola viridarii TaxID=412690 RepID=A0A109QWJ5_9MICO|nr:NAD(P)/FAD-dependent oxidoreductase [Microterricola viridarii]AMB58142.1 pyridine nucleotide-disulfide oxidoreductase [Microterricola viridarii]
MSDFDVAVIGAGPAGLSAALGLVRSRRTVLLIDSNRPRNAATLRSHGFLTRDGVPPLELRKLGREEFEGYPGATFHAGLVQGVQATPDGFRLSARGIRGASDLEATVGNIVVATGLIEKLPSVPSLRAWYGTDLHSCVECDGYEKRDAALALIGESDDLAERALLISQWSSDLIVFTNGVPAVTEAEQSALARRGVRIERRPIADVVGERGRMTGVLLADGETIPREAGFVRPEWTPAIAYLDGLGVRLDDSGLIAVDALGRTSVPGIYAAGDSTAPGPEQLIIAAGHGAQVAAALNRDLLGPLL